MSRQDTYVGVIHSTVLAFAIGLGGVSFAVGEEPPSPPPPSEDSIIERGVIRDHRTKPGTFTPAQKAPPPDGAFDLERRRYSFRRPPLLREPEDHCLSSAAPMSPTTNIPGSCG